MQEFGGNFPISPELLPTSTRFTHLDRPKRCKSGGLICLLPPHSYTILPPLKAQCSPKRRKKSELHLPKKSSHCSPNLMSFYPPWKPNAARKDVRVLSCIFLKNPPIAAPPLHHLTPLGSPTLTSFYPLKLTLF